MLSMRSVALLGSLRRDSEFLADTPLESRPPGVGDGLSHLVLAAGLSKRRSAKEVLADYPLVCGRRFVVLEALGELVSMVKDVLDGTGHGNHLKNLSRATMA